jgi:hypothetical protein
MQSFIKIRQVLVDEAWGQANRYDFPIESLFYQFRANNTFFYKMRYCSYPCVMQMLPIVRVFFRFGRKSL